MNNGILDVGKQKLNLESDFKLEYDKINNKINVLGESLGKRNEKY